jgi:hypothetical protein
MNEARVDFRRELFKGFTQRVGFRYFTFDPTFAYGYYENPENIAESEIRQTFSTSEAIFESRYARDEMFIQSDNDRISLGATKWPVITVRYTHGFKGLMASDFDYEKLRLSVYKRIKFGPLGLGYLNVAGEKVFGSLPYPLLGLHLGNQSFFYTPVTYNLMNYGEFVSDQYVTLQYQHHFEGFLLNRIPLMRKLKWRLVGSANVIWGSLSQGNIDLNAPFTPEGEETLPLGYFDSRPYVEIGYGVENIFRFFRIDFVHRMSYLERPDIRGFAVMGSFQFSL